MASDRRQFLQMLSTAMLAPMAFSQMKAAETKASKIPLAFSTLGCPGWEWPKILDFAVQHGFAAIELRGLEKNLDLPSLPLFAADHIEQTKKEIRDSKLRIACVSSSAQMYLEDPVKRAKRCRTQNASSTWRRLSKPRWCACLAARRNPTRARHPTMRPKRESPQVYGNSERTQDRVT